MRDLLEDVIHIAHVQSCRRADLRPGLPQRDPRHTNLGLPDGAREIRDRELDLVCVRPLQEIGQQCDLGEPTGCGRDLVGSLYECVEQHLEKYCTSVDVESSVSPTPCARMEVVCVLPPWAELPRCCCSLRVSRRPIPAMPHSARCRCRSSPAITKPPRPARSCRPRLSRASKTAAAVQSEARSSISSSCRAAAVGSTAQRYQYAPA